MARKPVARHKVTNKKGKTFWRGKGSPTSRALSNKKYGAEYSEFKDDFVNMKNGKRLEKKNLDKIGDSYVDMKTGERIDVPSNVKKGSTKEGKQKAHDAAYAKAHQKYRKSGDYNDFKAASKLKSKASPKTQARINNIPTNVKKGSVKSGKLNRKK